MGLVTNPDNSILIFQANDRTDGPVALLMACKKDENGNWGDPVALNEKINKDGSRFASFSPDGKYFFFAVYKNDAEKLYWIRSDQIF